jgi:hypothetical protein
MRPLTRLAGVMKQGGIPDGVHNVAHCQRGDHPLRLAAGATLISGDSFRSVIVRRQIEQAVVVNQAEPNAVQPTSPSKNVLDDRRIGEEVDERVSENPKNLDTDLVAESFKGAVGRPKTLESSAGHIQS